MTKTMTMIITHIYSSRAITRKCFLSFENCQLFKWTLSQQLRKGKAACRGLTACVSWNDVDDFGMPIKSYGDSGSCQHTHTHTNARRRQVRFVKLAQ